MLVIPRNYAQGGFNVIRKNGGVHRHMSLKTEGQGLSKDFYEKTNVSHPYKSLATKNVKSLDTLKVKSSRPKKYISLNI